MLEPIPIAILLAIIAGAIWRAGGRHGLPVLAFAWVAYAVYEYLMFKRVLCTGECNIRVDLLLFYPVLLGSTVWSGIGFARRRWMRHRGAGIQE